MQKASSGDMADHLDAGRNAQLVIELASGTVIVNDEELELPLREFRLLAELAKRVGQPISAPELIETVWPDEPWTPKENLYILVTRLRRLIDGEAKFGKNIRNRRGFGYLLDLPAEDVRVVDSSTEKPGVQPVEPSQPGAVTPTGPSLAEPAPGIPVGEPEPEAEAAPPRPRRSVLAPVFVGATLVIGSWAAGYLLSSHVASREPGPRVANNQPAEPQPSEPQRPASDDTDDKQNRPKKVARGTRQKERQSSRTRAGAGQLPVAAPPSAEEAAPPVAAPGPSDRTHKREGEGAAPRSQPPPEPALPPAPTRYLYHLINQQTGDHFVTTDANTASESEARGFVGGPIARVYTSPEKETKAIQTNHGTAYIFISSSPRTEPASNAVPLWYATNGSGDFFYTTNQGEAGGAGWQARVIGYVRSL